MIRVLFDDTEINGNYILNLTQIVEPYNQNFIIGNTVCRQFSIDVKDVGYSTIPDKVYLYEDNGSDTQSEWTKYATLLIDNTEVKDEHYTTFSLTDVMVRFNVDLTYTVGQTVLQILNNICTSKGITLNTQSFYMSDLSISWQDQIQERDLISYVAEVNGGYAYIDEDGNLNFEAYTNIPASNIDINKCSSYKVGELHKIGRVYVELATATQYYPQTTSDDTLYLNPDNILFTDSQGYTIENTIKHIYDSINGFMFYNMAIEQCPIDPNVRAGQIISVSGWSRLLTSDGDYILTSDGNKILVTEGLLVPFLCSINWKYNTQWIGGYTTDLDCKVQEETQIVDTKKKFARINIKVDREIGVISQSVAQLDDDLNEVEAKLELKVSRDDNDQIISMINASADNIILNTKSLIFGVYPNGQYIEVKNYYSGSTPIGVTFDGTGYIRMRPQEEFYLQNVDSSENIINSLRLRRVSNQSRFEMSNNNYTSKSFANSFTMTSQDNQNSNRIQLDNRSPSNSLLYNQIGLNATPTNSSVFMENYSLRGNDSTSFTMSANSTTDYIQMAIYQNEGSMSSANILIRVENSSDGAIISLYSRPTGATKGARVILNGTNETINLIASQVQFNGATKWS